MNDLLMIDLCSGLGGASAAMRERGWTVVTVDNEARFSPTHAVDVREWSWSGRRPDLVWASPPCTEFSRESMPWTRRGIVPDMSIVEACVRIARESQARFWLVENTRGAIKWFRPLLGEPKFRMSPQFLWGVPPVGFQPAFVKLPKKQHGTAELRALVPWHISLALARAVELDRGDRRRRRRTDVASSATPAQLEESGARPANQDLHGRNELGRGGDRAVKADAGPCMSAPARARTPSG